jgi:hypothetical protein
MGNAESSNDYTNQQQYIQQLQHQIKQNKEEINRMKLHQLNNPELHRELQTNVMLNNKQKMNKDSINKSIVQNNTKLAKIDNLIKNHRHQMTNIQYQKVSQMKQTIETSNQILIEQLREITQYADATRKKINKLNSYGSSFNMGTTQQDNYNRELQVKEQLDTVGKLSRHYKDDEERERIEFEMEEKRRREAFLENQRRRRLEYQNKLNELEKQNIDALKLFGLQQNYSLDDLKRAYKKMAVKTHPDRPGGSNQKFQLVTKCYMSLLEKHKLQQADKTYMNLREGSQKYMEEQRNKKQVKFDKENFDLKLFNKIYEQNKLWDPNDDGYNDWLKNDDEDKPEDTPLFSKKFNLNIFNSTFEDYKKKNCQDIVEYRGPQALVSANIGFTDVDDTQQIGDFTKSADLKGAGGIEYTDLKTAYTNRGALIDPNSVEYTTYNSIDELKRARSKISYTMTPEQIREQELQKMREQEAEELRQKRIRERDFMISQNYSRVHQQMLGYAKNPDLKR